MDQFWLTDDRFAKIALHLPADTRGKERVDSKDEGDLYNVLAITPGKDVFRPLVKE